MTFKHAILSCKHEYRAAAQGHIEESCVMKVLLDTRHHHKEMPRGDESKFANRIYSAVELDGLATESGSFNGFL